MRRLIIAIVLCWLADGALAGDQTFEQAVEKSNQYLQRGQYQLALETLEEAEAQSIATEQSARAHGLTGMMHYRMHHFERAQRLLEEAVQPPMTDSHEKARWLAALADLLADQGNVVAAQQRYIESAQLAQGAPTLQTAIRLGQAALLPHEHKLNELQAIALLVRSLEQPQQRAAYAINLASQAKQLGASGVKTAYESLEQARVDAGNDARLRAEALRGLAQLYDEQSRTDDALQYNHDALVAARSVDAQDLLLDLESREGRLQRALGHESEAMLAYERAVNHIEAIRHDIPVEYHNGRSSFVDTLAPVYTGLADLQLRHAVSLNGEAKTAMLKRARDTVEKIKQSELEDFLGGRCAVQSAKKATVESLDTKTAVIYPIILPDRLELLVSSGDEIAQFTQVIKADALRDLSLKVAKSFRKRKDDYLLTSQTLYQHLIAPIAPWLQAHQARNLVIVPDGALRLVPLAALHDGQQYLIERYAVSTSPGLTLIDATPLHRRGIHSLIAGMSEPGPVISNLPKAFFQNIALASARGTTKANEASRELPMDIEALEGERAIDSERMMNDPEFVQKLKTQLKLPGVAREVENLSSQVANNDRLLNESFTVENFERQVTQEPYSVVHIASHGVFGRTADTSFIMAYDNVIDMDKLERLLKSDKFKQNPVELLTLSACQTAEGDDRAPLGLSGVAIKARVRSALGTLWPVNDEAAAKLMTQFYKALSSEGHDKVQALREAQRTLLSDSKLNHPYYWAPFVLVGNWM